MRYMRAYKSTVSVYPICLKDITFAKTENMKKYICFTILITLFNIGCKTDKKVEVTEPEEQLSVLEKIAKANGYDNWNNIEEIKFTFNVDRDTVHFERSWVWNTRTNDVSGTALEQTSTYNRAAVDSASANVDKAFINDKYWMLAPINIRWDKENLTEKHIAKAVAPISRDTLQQLTVVYNTIGGYTPGDAYDFYFGNDYIVKEWAFRRGNQEVPNTVTTWEDYVDMGGLKIAQTHKNEDGSFKLSFTNLSVKTR